MQIETLPCPLTVCKVAQAEDAIAALGQWTTISVTDDEISLVCPTDRVPSKTIARDDGWNGFRVKGTLDFSLIGILAKLSDILAQARISIFAISTFDTDYILVRSKDFSRAINALSAAGYEIASLE